MNTMGSGHAFISQGMLSLANLDQRKVEELVREVPGGGENVQDIYPLSPLQEGMLFHHLLNREADTYVLATLFELRSRRHGEMLVDALQKVIDRHDVLRSAIRWNDIPRPVQIVQRRATLPVDRLALETSLNPIEQLNERMRPGYQVFDLTTAPLMRLLIATDTRRDIAYGVLHVHHLICDHQSLRNLIDEVLICAAGRERELPPPAQFKSYVEQTLKDVGQGEEAFFRSKLGDIVESTAPFAVLDVHGIGGGMKESVHELNPELAAEVRVQARRYGVSAARLFHAAWALVLAHTSARDDVVFGTVVLAGSQKGTRTQRMLGMSVNTLPLRLRLQGLTAQRLVEETHRELVELLKYEATPLTVSQRCSGIADSAPLFTSLLNYRHSFPVEADMAVVDGISVLARRDAWTNYPITLTVDDLGTGFALTAHTDRSVDPKRVIAYLCTAVESLVGALERSPQAPVLKLSILPESERRLVIEGFNATRTTYGHEQLVHELVESQARRTPSVIAVRDEGESLTYSELNDKANGVAGYLRSEGVENQLVGVCVERSVEMVVAVLGILKAGAAYVPLDPTYPIERLQYMVEDAQPKVVLAQEGLRSVLSATSAKIALLDLQHREATGHSPESLPAAASGLTSQSLVYVIYTSGSTGRPKGTAMAHRSMVNLIEWHSRELPLRSGQRVLQFASLSFDVAFQEIFSTLCGGGTLVLVNEWVRRDAQALLEFLNEQAIERMFVPPLMLQSLAEQFEAGEAAAPVNLIDVISAGEQLRISPEISNYFKHLPGCRLHNHYGPTETHVVTALTLTGDPGEWPKLPQIGRPISNTQIYVLNEERQPMPIGVAGEIYIGGAGVARGYQNRPELTEQRFVADVFDVDNEAKLYRSGDVGRWSVDGLLEYLGRNDDQVKIRGFRIELGEIETQLAQHEYVKEVAVIARENIPGEKRLVAYVTSRDQSALNTAALREYLQVRLPEYMIPSVFVMLDHLPITPTGKLDRQALPEPDLEAYVSEHYEDPQGEVEETLAQVWQEVLHVDRVGRNDNFFDLGGHSLLIAQVMARVRLSLLVEPNLRALFEHPTLKELAAYIEGMRSSSNVLPNLAEHRRAQ